MAIRYLFGRNRVNNNPQIFNVDDNGFLKVSNYDNTNVKTLRSEGLVYMTNKTFNFNGNSDDIIVINNPSDSNVKIFIYDIDIDVKGNTDTDLILCLYNVNSVINPTSHEYNSLVVNAYINDNIVINSWDSIDYYNNPIYQRLIDVTGIYKSYNFNFNNDMLQLNEDTSILFSLKNTGIYNNVNISGVINIKFIII